LAEGDGPEIADRDIRPVHTTDGNAVLDRLKLSLAKEVVSRCSADEIRAKILANLKRWQASGVWGPAYETWRGIAESGDDEALFAAMLGKDERATSLRNSAPYTGLLPKEVVRRLNANAFD
jgi:hypothetical protein